MKLAIAIAIAIALLLGGVWVYYDRNSAKLLLPLLMAGGLAGVVQALIMNQNVLTLPTRVDAGHFDLGFVADLLIGMVGAFASLIVGLAVLNDRFFHDPMVPATTGSTGTVAGTSRAFVDVVMLIPTWLRIASFGALTGYASRRLLPDLSNKIATMVSGALDKELGKQVQNRIENDRSQAELLGLLAHTVQAQDQSLAQTHKAAVLAATAKGVAPPAAIDNLLPLVSDFTKINVADYETRVAQKREKAEKMLGVAFMLNVSADDILTRIRSLPAGAPDLDGWLTALASVISLTPHPGDGARLLGVAGLAHQKFVKYRILLAFYSLKAQRLVDDNETQQVLAFIQSCLQIDDASLRKKAQATREFFTKG